MDMNIPPLKIKIMLESNPPKSIVQTGEGPSGRVSRGVGRAFRDHTVSISIHYLSLSIYIYIIIIYIYTLTHIYIYIYIHTYIYTYTHTYLTPSKQDPDRVEPISRPRQNMVGADMVSEEYHQHILKYQITHIFIITMFQFDGILLTPCLLQPFVHVAGTVDFRSFIVFFGVETLAHWNPTSCQKNIHNYLFRIWDSQIENSKIEMMETDRICICHMDC